jgi:hypothetical protein
MQKYIVNLKELEKSLIQNEIMDDDIYLVVFVTEMIQFSIIVLALSLF